ncbi:MAG TPA: S8 family serine peptidase, partial [Pyrinomonadaceae bacterium]|nr:S8 family serine peptidase [Pyrinomonadaceae bacterium]
SPSILSVASSDQNDNRSGFSNYGIMSVDLAAPGSGIISTIRGETKYGGSSGTSMAAPHVSGAAALLASYNPNLSAQSLKATLMNTVDRLPQWNNFVKTGGRLNVGRALQNQIECVFTLDKNSQVVFPEGGTFSFSITSAENCDYSVVSDSSWIIIESGSTGSGNGTITFRVSSNAPDMPRGGTISVAGQTFSVTQRQNETSARGFLDFDGDGRTDFTAIQNVSGGMLWHIYQNTGGYKAAGFGLFDDDISVPALYDDDLKTDIAVWRNSTGTFYVLRSKDNTVQVVQFGLPGDNPTVTQDFDGDGRADFAVTRQVDGKLVWYILLSTGGFRVHQFGNATDQALRGDYDGDGRADLAVYRPASDTPANTFFVQKSSDNNWMIVPFGVSTTDKPLPADFDGDGKTDISVWRMTDGVWHYLKSSDGSYNAFKFGQSGDLPTPGDYDGDGKTDFSVWRPNASQNESGVFYIYSVLNGFQAVGWGNSTMKIPANTLQSR